jgi:hypothetical protein
MSTKRQKKTVSYFTKRGPGFLKKGSIHIFFEIDRQIKD